MLDFYVTVISSVFSAYLFTIRYFFKYLELKQGVESEIIKKAKELGAIIGKGASTIDKVVGKIRRETERSNNDNKIAS